MEFNKNSELIQNICLVQIRSVDQTVDIPTLQTIYHTPSSISLTGSSAQTDAGVLSKRTLTLNYPGITEEDFDKFNTLVRGAYQIYIKTTDFRIFEVASERFFATCSTSFDIKEGHKLRFESSSPIPVKYRGIQIPDGITTDGFDYDFDFYLE